MPHLIDTDTRAGALTSAINHLIAREGLSGLTLRKISEVSRVSTSSMLHHLGSRERMLLIAAGQTAQARADQIAMKVHLEGALAFLPDSASEVVDARVWLGWQEMWRSHDWLASALGRGRLLHLEVLAYATALRLEGPQLTQVETMINGLLMAVTAPTNPMSTDDARAVLAAELERLGLTEMPEQPYSTPAYYDLARQRQRERLESA